AVAWGLVFDLEIPVWQQAVIGGVVGVVAQWGDLIESKLKRIADVKDAGSIIPGHGGLLDRLDSLLLTLPAVYYLLVTVFVP
ncbi:MAG: phosphatidate cytidylyltransferase, partial [Chloroflexi bacterium]|nr:phosphatidate cytidylyltransferase [Chloroflexota bacterium]